MKHLKALLPLVIFLTSVPASLGTESTHILIAAGIPTQPASSQPTSTFGQPSQMPSANPNSSETMHGNYIPEDTTLIPPPKSPENFSINKTPRAAEQSPQSAKPPAKVQIEYDEALAPESTQPGLSVVQALNQALINSPRAAAIRAQFAITRARYALATQAPNPVFFRDRGLVAEQVTRIGPTLTFEPPWKLLFRMLSTKHLVDQTKIDLLREIWSFRANVRRAYVEVVVAQETMKTLNLLYELASKLLAVAEKRFHAGDVPELDVLKARLANSQALVDIGVGRKRVLRAKQQLNIMMGKEVDDPVNVPALPTFAGPDTDKNALAEKSDVLPDFDINVPPLPHFLSLGMDHRLELKSLSQQIKLNQTNTKLAYMNVIPNPSITLGQSNANNPVIGPKLSAVFFTINAEVPFSNFNQGDIYRFKATGKQLDYQVGAQRNQIMSDVSGAYQNLVAQRERLRVFQEHVLADSYAVARLARRSYEVGQSDITSTWLAQQANVQIRGQYLDAVASYAHAFADLEQACGLPLQ